VGQTSDFRGGSTIEFLLETRSEDAWAIVALGGEVDAHSAPRLRDGLRELFDDGRFRIVVEADRVEFMDSTALGVLVNGFKRATEHDGILAVVCTRPNVIRLLEITGLDKVFPVFSSLEQAMTA
jgi:anti-sigma B factor antagonist